jgi:hypothetical protein
VNPFQEAYQKALGEGLAKWTLRGIGILLVTALGFVLQHSPIIALTLLAVAAMLLMFLAAYAFGWATSYRKTRARIVNLENRVDAHDARQEAEDKFFRELNESRLKQTGNDTPKTE